MELSKIPHLTPKCDLRGRSGCRGRSGSSAGAGRGLVRGGVARRRGEGDADHAAPHPPARGGPGRGRGGSCHPAARGRRGGCQRGRTRRRLLLVGVLLDELLALLERQDAPPEDVAALGPDGREEDAGVEGEDLVAAAAEEVGVGGGALLELGADVGEGLVHPGGHLAGLGDDGAADVGGGHEDHALVGQAQPRGPGVEIQ